MARTKGIIPALESAHAVAEGVRLATTLPADQFVVINVSGRGDKDLFTLARHNGDATPGSDDSPLARSLKFRTFLQEELARHDE